MFLYMGGGENMITETLVPTSLANDLLFKEVLSHPDNRDKLIYFLSVLMDLSEDYLKNNFKKVLYESILLKTKVKDKAYRGDVVVELNNLKINLECYSIFDKASFIKSLSYVLRIYSTGMERGDKEYSKMDKVIGINIIDNVNYDFMEEKDYSKVKLVYEKKTITNTIELEFYRLDKIRNKTYNEGDKKMQWLKFIGAKDYEERKTIAKGDERLMELNEWVEAYINDEHTKEVYGKWAEEIALNKGKRVGINSIAKEMILKNYPIEEIREITKLSTKEINEIKKEMD